MPAKVRSNCRLTLLNVAAAGGLLVACFGGTAHAVVLWYDGFDTTPGQYTAGASIAGQSGGAGSFFTGPWVQPGGDDQLVLASSLSQPSQTPPSIGGALGDNDAANCCITGRVGRMFAQPWSGPGTPEGTFYIGFLANYGKVDGGGIGDVHHRALEMWDAGFDDPQRNLMLGYSTFSGLGSQLALLVKDSSSNTTVVKQLNEHLEFVADGVTHSLVMKFELSNASGADSVSVFLDPTSSTEPAPSATISGADFAGGLDLLLDRMGGITNFSFNTNSDHAAAMDEIRVGTTFADVAVVKVFLPGDFDKDGHVDLTDYLTLSANLFTDVSGLTVQQAYLLGDMTSDRLINGNDLRSFRFAYDDANGEAAFVAMLASIPEPAAGVLAAVGAAIGCLARRRALAAVATRKGIPGLAPGASRCAAR